MAEDVKRKISIFINDREVVDSLGGIGREIGEIKRKLKETSDPAERAKLNKELQATRKRYGEIKEEINDTNVSLQEQRSHFSNLFSGLVTGDIDQVQDGLRGIKGGIKGATKAARAFIATPIGLAITALAGIALATKEWIGFNEAAKEANITAQEIINLTGQELDNARIRAEALSEIFTKSTYEENLETAKALVKGFAISYDEAFDLIEDSYVRGATANKEFNDSIIEFSAIQEKAGFTAKQTVHIINTAYEQGLYKDKLIDSIKEVDTALTEQTNSTKDALENAFGQTFTSNLFTGIETGVISTKDAIALMAQEAETAHLNEQQYGQLTADVFKSAGEDIAGAEKVLSVYNITLNKQAETLTPLQQETKRLADAHLEMKQAQDDALKSDSYAKFSNDVTIIWTKTKTFFYNIIGGLVQGFQNFFLNIKLGFSDLKIAFNELPQRFSATKEILINAAAEIVSAFSYIGNAWSALKKGDFSGVTRSFLGFKDSIKNTASQTLEAISSVGDKIAEEQLKARQAIIKNHFDSIEAAGVIQENENNPKGNSPEVRGRKESAFTDLIEKRKEESIKEIDLALETELAKVKGVEDAENQKLKIREKYSKVKSKLDKDDIRLENALNSQRAQSYANTFGQIAQLLGKNTAAGKAAAIAQATMNTYQGVTEVWSTKSVLPEPFATISRIANTAIVLGSGFKSIQAIKSTKAKGFFKGGYTGNNPIRHDGQDGVAFDTPQGPFHVKEWVAPRVMVESPVYGPQIAALENERKRIQNGYYQGGFVADENNEGSETSQNQSSNNNLVSVLQRNNQLLQYLIDNGVIAVLSDDMRNMKRLKYGLDKYDVFNDKNKLQ